MTAGPSTDRYDVAVIGGGFFGCCIAHFMRSLYPRVVILERADALMTRASATNQARVHAGFHYPRSFVTALRSVRNFPRFVELFADAIVDDFDMLYAIARYGSKVSANRFARMFGTMGAAFAPAAPRQRALFDARLIEAVFACREFAFDHVKLREQLAHALAAAGVEVRHGAEALSISEALDGGLRVVTGDGSIEAPTVFNAGYSEINHLLRASALPPFGLKHEWTEVALIAPPDELRGVGVTVMDGPFFSAMPFPSEAAYSLTHVAYTPHLSWADRGDIAPSRAHAGLPQRSRWYHMVADGRRYLPCLSEARWQGSRFEVKTVLTSNEGDDGRPILFQRHAVAGCLFSVLGGKIDNIFDLFEAIRGAEPEWAAADLRFLAAAR